jgi:hypothetical protein
LCISPFGVWIFGYNKTAFGFLGLRAVLIMGYEVVIIAVVQFRLLQKLYGS